MILTHRPLMGTITGVQILWIKLYSLRESSSHVFLVVAFILFVSSPRCYLPFMQCYTAIPQAALSVEDVSGAIEEGLAADWRGPFTPFSLSLYLK